jgi:uncharacterized protein YndB with AHSA1/START domain
VVEAQRIVFTTMLTSGWRPNSPWLGLTAIIAMADEADGTRYTARVMHKDAADSKRHEGMGFFDGWGICITQLEEAAGRL